MHSQANASTSNFVYTQHHVHKCVMLARRCTYSLIYIVSCTMQIVLSRTQRHGTPCGILRRISCHRLSLLPHTLQVQCGSFLPTLKKLIWESWHPHVSVFLCFKFHRALIIVGAVPGQGSHSMYSYTARQWYKACQPLMVQSAVQQDTESSKHLLHQAHMQAKHT